MHVLGVKIDQVSRNEAVELISFFLDHKKQCSVVTPNPEIIMAAQKDEEYRKILNHADLSIPDGVGLRLAGLKYRVTGADMVGEICKLAAARKLRIGLLGGLHQAALLKAAHSLKETYGVNVVFAEYGPAPEDWKNLDLHEKLIQVLTKAAPDILFVGFGHPKQEFWIHTYQGRLPSVRVCMGVGGALDFFAGERTRAPLILQRLGLEWFWRLINEPQRIHRIITAVITFPLALLHDRSKQKNPS